MLKIFFGFIRLLIDKKGELRVGSFVLLSTGLPLILLWIHHDLGHQGDLRTFFDWYHAVSQSAAFYRDSPGINYPILGVLAYTVPGWLVETWSQQPLDFEGFRWVVKITLVIVEIGLIYMLAQIARASGIGRPRLFAVGLYLLPATWAGGAWFGQIDVLGTLLLVTAAFGFFRFALSGLDPGSGVAWLCLGLGGLQGSMLTKQLTLFSVPGLLGMLALGLIIHFKKKGARLGLWMVCGGVMSFVLLALPDVWLVLPAGYFSHLQYIVFGGGSAHGDIISGNGANVWVLLVNDPGASSRTPVFGGCSLKCWGLFLFFFYQVILVGWLFREGRRLFADKRPEKERVREALGCGLLYIGACNLAMATLLTGVHERYLVHAVPFLLVGIAARARLHFFGARWLSAFMWLVTGWSGLFVLSSIHWGAFDGWLALFRSHSIMGVLEFLLLVTLAVHLWVGRRPDSETGLKAGETSYGKADSEQSIS